MSYRQTEKVKAHLTAQREAIIDAAIDVLAKGGIETLIARTVAAKAKIAYGSIYNYFADTNELFNAVVAKQLARDVESMREAADKARGLGQLARAVENLFLSIDRPRLAHALNQSDAYKRGIIAQLAKLTFETNVELTPKAREMAAAGALGAILAINALTGPSKDGARAASLFVLRAIGVSDAAAKRVTA